MGTNINVYLEEKMQTGWRDRNAFDLISQADFNGENNRFHPMSLFTGRNYAMFNLMAGVRRQHHIESISSPRGMPVDATPIIKEIAGDMLGEVYHDCSWLGLDELFEAAFDDEFRKQKQSHSVPMESAIDGIHTLVMSILEQLDRMGRACCIEELYEKRHNFRIIFWFED